MSRETRVTSTPWLHRHPAYRAERVRDL